MVHLSSIAALTAGLLPLYVPALSTFDSPYAYNRRADSHSTNAAGLHSAAVSKGLSYFGTATDNPELTDATYMKQLNNTDDFGQVTPGNSMKVCRSYTYLVELC